MEPSRKRVLEQDVNYAQQQAIVKCTELIKYLKSISVLYAENLDLMAGIAIYEKGQKLEIALTHYLNETNRLIDDIMENL